jgi:hypothetical protein
MTLWLMMAKSVAPPEAVNAGVTVHDGGGNAAARRNPVPNQDIRFDLTPGFVLHLLRCTASPAGHG